MDVKFKTKHIIMLSKIVSKMDIKIDIKGKPNTKEGQMELGGEILMSIFKNLYLAEDAFYELLSDLLGVPVKQVAEMPIEESFETLKVVVTELINFIKKQAA